MAIRPFNSIEGYSVGSDPQIAVIDSNGNITATNLTVDGVSNLGPIGNVKITGGTNGQALFTDGAGNLNFQTIESNNAGPMPYFIPEGESYIVKNNFQGLFAKSIDIEGELVVEGELIDVSSWIQYPDNHILFASANYAAGNAGFTFNPDTGAFAVPGTSTFSGDLLPNTDITYSLGNATRRWSNLYLSGNTIYLGDSTITTDANTLVLTNGNGGTFEVAGNSEITTIQNGTSNIAVEINGNVTTSVSGIANVLVVASTGATVLGTLAATTVTASNVKTDTLLYANGQPWDLQQPAGTTSQIQFNDNNSFGASSNLTFDSSNSVMTLTGNLVVGNVSNANLISANYLYSTSGCVVLGNGAISVSGNAAGIFNSSIEHINIGLAASNITIGSETGNVNIRGNVIASNVISSGLVTAQNITVGDLYSKRLPISVVAPNTVVDEFLSTEYRSAKYTIKASNDLGYQALEVLLIHDDINSIITVYGSLSTTGNDIVTITTSLDAGNVKLLATGIAANTVVNLMGTYVPD